MIIEALSISDIDAVLKIESHSFRQPWGRLSFLSELTCENAIGLVVRETMGQDTFPAVAYLCGRLIGDDFYILKIAVSDNRRGKGIASKLLNESFRKAAEKKSTSALLDVRKSNLTAINFYRRHGFKTVGIRPGYYSDPGEDALVMRKMLKEEA